MGILRKNMCFAVPCLADSDGEKSLYFSPRSRKSRNYCGFPQRETAKGKDCDIPFEFIGRQMVGKNEKKIRGCYAVPRHF